MNRLSTSERARVVASVVEGNSVRSTVRMTGVAKNTIVKLNPEGQTRYSPAKSISCTPQTISGNPDPKHISTGYVERQNLTMRMSMRRFTRLTNAFSKNLENHAAMVALYFMFYNFGRVHQTLRVTPAMEAGIADHVWSIDEIVSLLDK